MIPHRLLRKETLHGRHVRYRRSAGTDPFCDASGLAVLVGIQHRARPLGITVALTAPRPFMSRLLRMTGLDRSLPVMT
ncbi:STAS domain-containing protein [Nonomuraea sp. NPDC059007]|uniref:STAS domain-containing protein n=1 Tax=Nonomuraea sp. NPDC059007 TaxID=3346692 RepID=UPI0036B0267B